jgi:hypothetical protein
MFVAALIRGQIDEVDARGQMTEDTDTLESTEELISSSLEPPVDDGVPCQGRKTTFDAGAIVLRSHQPPVTLGSLEHLGAENLVFRNFRARLAAWLTHMLPLYGINFVPGCTRVQFQVDHQVGFTIGAV